MILAQKGARAFAGGIGGKGGADGPTFRAGLHKLAAGVPSEGGRIRRDPRNRWHPPRYRLTSTTVTLAGSSTPSSLKSQSVLAPDRVRVAPLRL
jgi:hypothetical protein